MKWIERCKKMLFALMTSALLSSCADLEQSRDQYQMTDHPLAGKVWDVAAQQFVEPAVLLQRAHATKFVLLGEIHDNREHHRIQARILQAVANGRRPALVMEQYDRNQQEKINTTLQGNTSAGVKLFNLAELMRKSWEWQAYEPLAKLALQQHLPVLAANLSRDELRTVSRNGFIALGAGEEQRLALETVWSPARQSRLMNDISQGHCGKVPEHMVTAIAISQRARDAVMADTMLLSKESGAVAIVGRGHAQRDMAIPLYLAARAPQATVLSLGIVEVDSPTDPAAYARGPLGPFYDYIWFTPRVARHSNPCDSIPQAGKIVTPQEAP
jgi:uncharacterized iron-regulated protein